MKSIITGFYSLLPELISYFTVFLFLVSYLWRFKSAFLIKIVVAPSSTSSSPFFSSSFEALYWNYRHQCSATSVILPICWISQGWHQCFRWSEVLLSWECWQKGQHFHMIAWSFWAQCESLSLLWWEGRVPHSWLWFALPNNVTLAYAYSGILQIAWLKVKTLVRGLNVLNEIIQEAEMSLARAPFLQIPDPLVIRFGVSGWNLLFKYFSLFLCRLRATFSL